MSLTKIKTHDLFDFLELQFPLLPSTFCKCCNCGENLARSCAVYICVKCISNELIARGASDYKINELVSAFKTRVIDNEIISELTQEIIEGLNEQTT